jgi:hypothetical protein
MAFTTTIGNTIYHFIYQGDELVLVRTERRELNPRHASDHAAA